MSNILREARPEDIPWMVGLTKSDGETEDIHSQRITELQNMISGDSIIVVSETDGVEDGFLTAKLLNAPPVYDPGGPVCFIEHLETGGDWSGVGTILIEEATRQVRERGGVLLRVVCSHGDSAKEEFLTGLGFTTASEWYFGSTAEVFPAPAPPGLIRKAEAEDLPTILRMADQKRDEYASYQPVFWRKSSSPPETFAPYMQHVLADARTTALVHELDGVIDGFVIATGDYIDDASVTPADAWATVGAALLTEAARLAHTKGFEAFRIVCAHGDTTKAEAITRAGFTHVTDWYVRDLV